MTDGKSLFAVVCEIGAEGDIVDVGDEVPEGFFGGTSGTDDFGVPGGFGAFVEGPGVGDFCVNDVAVELVGSDAVHIDGLEGEFGFDAIRGDDGGVFADIGGDIETVSEGILECFVFFAADGAGIGDGGVVDGEVRGIGFGEGDGFGFEFADGACGHCHAREGSGDENRKRFFHGLP